MIVNRSNKTSLCKRTEENFMNLISNSIAYIIFFICFLIIYSFIPKDKTSKSNLSGIRRIKGTNIWTLKPKS